MRKPLVTTAALFALLAGCSPTADSGASSLGAAADATVRTASSAPTRQSVGPSDTGSSTAALRHCPNPYGGACLGALKPGTYETSMFQPQLRYTVPAGWVNDEDLPGNFLLFRKRERILDVLGQTGYLGIYANVRAAAINCAESAQPGVTQTPQALVAWFQSIPGLVVSDPMPVMVGGLDGLQVDLTLKPGVDTCSYDGYTGIPLITGNGVSHLHHVIVHEIDVRLVILAWGRKGNVTLEITSVKQYYAAEEYRTVVQPIVDSLEFRP